MATLVAVAPLVVACGGEGDATAVLLRIEAAGSSRPFTATLDWLGPDGALIVNQRLPAQGVFPLANKALTSVYIEAGAPPAGARRALVVGRIDSLTFWGAARIDMIEGEVVEAAVVLREAPLTPDGDGDGVPDEFDDCPGHNDRLPCP